MFVKAECGTTYNLDRAIAVRVWAMPKDCQIRAYFDLPIDRDKGELLFSSPDEQLVERLYDHLIRRMRSADLFDVEAAAKALAAPLPDPPAVAITRQFIGDE